MATKKKAATAVKQKTAAALPVDGKHYRIYWPAGGKMIAQGLELRQRWAFYTQHAARIVCHENGKVLFERAA